MKKINQTFLFIYSILATLLLIMVLLFFLKNENSTKTFNQIQAQQIRIVEPDGTLRMIISNSKKLPGVIVHGKEVEQVDRPQAGMLFYNDEASENGGLIFSGS
jgi:CHASE3 domain sensor protein